VGPGLVRKLRWPRFCGCRPRRDGRPARKVTGIADQVKLTKNGAAWNRWAHPRAVAWALAGVALAALAWLAVVPAVAGREGWATRWPSRLPSTILFDGREYVQTGGCLAEARAPLGSRPARIGGVPVLLGSALPILARGDHRSGDPAEVAVVVRRDTDCYVEYALQGGP
jgi:hypothetical protein